MVDEIILAIMIRRLLLAHIHGCKSHIALLIQLCLLKVSQLALTVLALPVASVQFWITMKVYLAVARQ